MTALLTLRGPDFLALFIGFCVVVYFLVTAAVAFGEWPSTDQPRIRDPYVIAYLRGDLRELVRVVALSLVLRGLLKLDGDGLRSTDSAEIDRADVPIEKVILGVCRERSTPTQLERDTWVNAVGHDYQRYLLERGLLADESVEGRRRLAALVGISLVVGLALAKIVVALNTGHPNVLFLVIVTILTTILLVHKFGQRRTRKGEAVLSDLSGLFHTLKKRGDTLPVTAVPEATLLAAVFGVYVLPGQDSRLWRKIFPEPPASNSSGGASCGSSGCGGGGGCGGGCGGCGS